MRISKEKFARLRSRAGRAGKAVATGTRGAAVQVVAGAVAGIAHYAASSRVDFIGKNWWAGPVVLAVAGIAANRSAKLRGVGNALLGAAGYSAYVGYNVSHANAPAQTSGVEDTGLLAGSGWNPYRAPYLDSLPAMAAPAPAAAPTPVSETVKGIGLA